MASVWIVHRDPRRRAALVRLARLGAEVRTGAPGDPVFADAAPPRVIVLGVEGDFESELEFAHREASRLPGARWLLLARAADRSEVTRLFDSLAAEVLPFPPAAELLAARVRAAQRRRSAEGLSERRQRDALSERFSRWFADLDLPDLLRALDPRLAGVPLLVRGERGSGRALLAQYVHVFGGSAGSAFTFVPCAEAKSPDALLSLLRAAGESPTDRQGLTVCLEDADLLPGAVQQELRRWIEFGPPGGAVRATRLRWMATAGDDDDGALAPGLTDELAQALAGISVRIPPLRERSDAIERFAADTARAWCRGHGEPAPEFTPDALDALQDHPWPGNQRELEAVVVRTLAAGARGPLDAAALRFDGASVSDAEASAPAPAPARASEAAVAAPPPSARPAAAPSPPQRPAEPRPAAAPAAAPTPPPVELDRLARALGRELREPLVAMRSLGERLPERDADPELRKSIEDEVGRLEDLAERLSRFATPAEAAPTEVDVTALLEDLLEERREQIRSRRLLVLKELESEQPGATGRSEALRLVFEALIDRALAWIPDRGDLYVASRHHAAGPRGTPTLRVLLRFLRPAGTAREGADDASLDLLLAEMRLRAEGATLTASGLDGEEAVLVVDLPA